MIFGALVVFHLFLGLDILLCLLMIIMSWVYLLEDRLHVFVVKNFFAEIINQFAITPKNFRIDNALEFVQNPWIFFF